MFAVCLAHETFVDEYWVFTIQRIVTIVRPRGPGADLVWPSEPWPHFPQSSATSRHLSGELGEVRCSAAHDLSVKLYNHGGNLY